MLQFRHTVRTRRREPGQGGEKLFLPQKIFHPCLFADPGQPKGIFVGYILYMIGIEGYTEGVHPRLPQDLELLFGGIIFPGPIGVGFHIVQRKIRASQFMYHRDKALKVQERFPPANMYLPAAAP
jgi:hypothetical protein